MSTVRVRHIQDVWLGGVEKEGGTGWQGTQGFVQRAKSPCGIADSATRPGRGTPGLSGCCWKLSSSPWSSWDLQEPPN